MDLEQTPSAAEPQESPQPVPESPQPSVAQDLSASTGAPEPKRGRHHVPDTSPEALELKERAQKRARLPAEAFGVAGLGNVESLAQSLDKHQTKALGPPPLHQAATPARPDDVLRPVVESFQFEVRPLLALRALRK